MKSIERLPSESFNDYLIRLGNNLDTLNLNWIKVTEILNKQPEIEEDYSESKYRKDYASYIKWKKHIIENLGDNELIKELEDKTINLKKERAKLQSEKVEYNKLIREQARNELIEEKIINAIDNRPTITVPNINIKKNESKKDYLFPVADIHYSAEFTVTGWFDEILNQYSPEIAQKRMWSLLEQFVQRNDQDKINHVYLFNLGDSLDGILRMSQLQWIRLGNVDSAIEFAEFMSQWLNKLSEYTLIDYYATTGNHTELRLLNGQRGDFTHENMEKIVSHIIKSNLRNNERINIHDCKNHVYTDILGTKVLGVHGHEEKNLENSLTQYSKIYGHHVDLMISGHLHHSHEKTIGMNGQRDIKYVQVPSIVGIDDYSMKLKKTSTAGANLMIIEENVGRTVNYEIKL